MTGTIKESWLARQVDLAARREYAKPALSEAAIDVLCERRRQIEEEDWTPEHDDAHDRGELASAGAAYAYYAGLSDDDRQHYNRDDSFVGFMLRKIFPVGWYWHWFKPTTRRRDLVKSGACIIAEIERIDRAAAKGGEA